MRNIRLDIEYDGTGYGGWQRQENAVSVQASIEDVLAQVLQHPVTLYAAGRTDVGVHARGQVANFRTGSDFPCERLHSALLGLLPGDIVVKAVADVDDSFHARFSAKSRRYSYTIATVPTALRRNTVWYRRYPLDHDLMNEQASAFIGERDFQAFCRVQAEVNHYRCIVTRSEWEREGDFLVYHVKANRFLHGMVRTLVGTMVDIGRGYRPFSDLAVILELKDRTLAGPAAPSSGLVLEEVEY